MTRAPGPLKFLNARPKPEHAHVAEALREYVQRERITASDLSRRIGGPQAATSLTWPWLTGAGSIGAGKYRQAAAKLLGVPAEFFAPRPAAAEQALGHALGHALGPARQAVALARETGPVAAGAAGVGAGPAGPAGPVLGGRLSYDGHGDGTATILVRARLPLSQAKPLFRVLLDSGLDLVSGDLKTEETHNE